MGKSRFRQSGQAIVAALVLMLLGIAGLVLMYNSGQITSEKVRVVNAADAAAYSGGVWTARQLNFMAYTNRAMIANHVSVGHYVSYVSWIRNTRQNARIIARVTSFIPFVNAATSAINRFAGILTEATERFGQAYVPAVNAFNQSLYLSQIAATINLNPLTINNVMRSTARNYGDIQVNSSRDFEELISNYGIRGLRASERVADQFIQVTEFTRSYDATQDDSRVENLVNASLDSSERWIRGNRGWRVCLFVTCSRIPGNLRLTKRGSTVHTGADQGPTNECNRSFFSRNDNNGSNGLNWYAKDELQLEIARFRRFRLRWRNIARSCADANATEFSSTYRGIDNYVALRNENSVHQMLHVTAYATLDTDDATVPVFHTFRESNPSNPDFDVKLRNAITDEKVTAFAETEIFHGSDEVLLFSTEAGEFSNLFNPYWHARSSYGIYDRITETIAGVNDSLSR